MPEQIWTGNLLQLRNTNLMCNACLKTTLGDLYIVQIARAIALSKADLAYFPVLEIIRRGGVN